MCPRSEAYDWKKGRDCPLFSSPQRTPLHSPLAPILSQEELSAKSASLGWDGRRGEGWEGFIWTGPVVNLLFKDIESEITEQLDTKENLIWSPRGVWGCWFSWPSSDRGGTEGKRNGGKPNSRKGMDGQQLEDEQKWPVLETVGSSGS